MNIIKLILYEVIFIENECKKLKKKKILVPFQTLKQLMKYIKKKKNKQCYGL